MGHQKVFAPSGHCQCKCLSVKLLVSFESKELQELNLCLPHYLHSCGSASLHYTLGKRPFNAETCGQGSAGPAFSELVH